MKRPTAGALAVHYHDADPACRALSLETSVLSKSGLTVAAHDRDFNIWSGSNYGDRVDVTAPGVDIVSAMPNGGYQAQTGTGMASPHAAAACAMPKSRNPEMSADEIMSAIKNAAVDRGITGGGTGVLCMTALIGEIMIIPGDANGDGNVDVADALLALRYSIGLSLPNTPACDSGSCSCSFYRAVTYKQRFCVIIVSLHSFGLIACSFAN